MAAPVIADGGTCDERQAVDCVSKLCSLPLPTNSHPNIHASSSVVDYRVDVNVGFCDRNAFVAAMAKYLEEAAEQAKMVLLTVDWNSSLITFAVRKYLVNYFLLWDICDLPSYLHED